MVELDYRGRKVRGATWILPGQADDCVTVHLGYGRTRAGKVGSDTGFNANALRTSDALWHSPGVQIRKTGEQHPLACTQFHHLMEGRQLVRAGTLAEYRKNPNFVRNGRRRIAETLYPGFKYAGYAWEWPSH
jgi:molybdopterin-containing oxidoreductase family iron-sulfur binding subunit